MFQRAKTNHSGLVDRYFLNSFWVIDRMVSADMEERMKVDTLSVQNTRWKGSKGRSTGSRFKLLKLSRGNLGGRVHKGGDEESVRQDHEFEVRNTRGDVECCQCLCPTGCELKAKEEF